ncbi:hypothetical protein A7H90_01135, partial [Escherichia coli]
IDLYAFIKLINKFYVWFYQLINCWQYIIRNSFKECLNCVLERWRSKCRNNLFLTRLWIFMGGGDTLWIILLLKLIYF